MEYEIFRTDDGSDSVRLKGTAVSFHSTRGALQESTHIFIENAFQYYLQQHPDKKIVNIFEVGFGTGLNALLTAITTTKNSKDVIYTAIDLHPLPIEIYTNLNYASLLNEPELYKIIMQTGWDQLLYISPFFKLQKIKTDLATYTFSRQFDIIYFDAFAPDDQSEMWSEEVYIKLYNALSHHGILVTYCSKSVVRKGLQDAGFYVEKLEGPPGKREIIRATRN